MPEKTRQNSGEFAPQEADRLVQQARKDLLGNVTYGLLTPLTTIRLLAETLHSNMVQDTQTQHAYYERIISETKYMEQMVADLAELSHLQGDCALFEKKPVRTIDIFGPVLERYLMRYTDLDTSLNIEGLNLDNLPHLQTNAEKLVRLINILLDNSVKFAGFGGTVSMMCTAAPRQVIFCIQSNGLGLAEEELTDLFNGFYQADAGRNCAVNSLEFTIAGQLAKRLDEKLWAERTAGGGTSFYFSVARK